MKTIPDQDGVPLRRAMRRPAAEGANLPAAAGRALAACPEQRRKSGDPLRRRPERGRLRPGVRPDDRGAVFDFREGRGDFPGARRRA